jgi:MarR family 2-MHQ and catechol resistance regulon transcriptional repressor
MNIEKALNTKFSSAQQKVIINLRYTSNVLSNYQNNFLSEYNISIAQFNILRILRGAKDELNVNTVKERMIEKSPNTTRLMDKLLAKEFIARRNCSEDRRVVYVEITKKGLNLLKVLDSKIQEASFTPKNITDEESELLSNLLDKLRGEFH